MHGAEPAADAARRFGGALAAIAAGPAPAAVVSHGRALTAYLASALPLDDAFAFWRAMPMPAWACIELAASGRARLIEPFAANTSDGRS
jgi:broad specificity phosphatase PhoE